MFNERSRSSGEKTRGSGVTGLNHCRRYAATRSSQHTRESFIKHYECRSRFPFHLHARFDRYFVERRECFLVRACLRLTSRPKNLFVSTSSFGILERLLAERRSRSRIIPVAVLRRTSRLKNWNTENRHREEPIDFAISLPKIPKHSENLRSLILLDAFPSVSRDNNPAFPIWKTSRGTIGERI